MAKSVKSIYTDGACAGNPGPGGWGVVIYFGDGSVHELGGRDPETTNNRMELQATIAALDYLQEISGQDSVPLYTDSQYVKKGITQWLSGWKRKGWKTAKGQPVLNQDLWVQLDGLNSPQVDWRYVRGHSGNVGNERCDEIARAFSTGRRPHLTQQKGDSTRPLTDEPLNSTPSQETSAPESVSPSPTAESTDQPSVDLSPVLERLRIAHEVASEGYWLTSTEVAVLTDQPITEINQRLESWTWRNWTCSRVTAATAEKLWKMERL